MAKGLVPQQINRSRGKRFSLRTLFFVSAVIAVPFLLYANLRHGVRPEETVASPLYLLLGIAGVVFAAAVGSAVGERAGLFAAAGCAAFSWIGAVYLCGLFSKELKEVLPVHAICAVATVATLAAVVWATHKPEEEGPHNMLVRLLKVKHDVQNSRAKGVNPPTSATQDSQPGTE